MNGQPRTVALIPAHNEALTIREVVDETAPYVDTVYVIDDGSTDETSALLDGSGARVIRHIENLGKGTRLVEGLDLSFAEGAERVITLDADTQHDPADIPAFIASADANPDAFILGDRSADMANMPKHRSRSIKFGNFFVGWACARRITDAQCGMRLYPASMWTKTTVPPKHIPDFKFETAILMYAAEQGVPFAAVPIKARYEGFVQRPSHFRPVKDILRLVSLIGSFLITRGLRPRGLLKALGLVR